MLRLYAASALAACFVSTIPLRAAPNLSPMAAPPDWDSLENFQETITRDEFSRLLNDVYCTSGCADSVQVGAETARFLVDRSADKWFTLRFAPNESSRKAVPVWWRRAKALGQPKEGRPLTGLKIALDPGHIGGSWARMEERWLRIGDSQPIQEGDMTLLVAKLLAPKLRALGAEVSFARDKLDPTTPLRADDLKEVARRVLSRSGVTQPREDFAGPSDPQKEQSVRWQSELLFYRTAEIRQRAARVNAILKPDLVLCLHFNAEPWNDPLQPTLTDRNHLHLLVNGSYLPPELELDDVRFGMIRRLLSRAFEEEAPLSERCATAMAAATKLPPYEYTTGNVTKLGPSGYVYLRNLLATRLYQSPVIYFEPYVMNSDEFFWRAQAGDYEGVRNVNGTDRRSIFREYADGVAAGVIKYYEESRQP